MENLPNHDPVIKQEQPTPEPMSTKQKIIRELISWVQVFVIALFGAWLLQNYVVVNATVPTGSMTSTINIGDRVLANRLAYKFGEIKRGDIIIFKYPDNEELLYVKRVIGLPGDQIEIHDQKVTVNGQVLNGDYLLEPTLYDWGPYNVPEDSYFCMGDNRNSSADSRYWDNTYVSHDKILGKVFLRYFPKFSTYKSVSYN